MEGYSDMNFADNKKGRKLVSGILVLVCGVAIEWAAKKQTAVALSTIESELVAAFKTAQAMLGIRELLEEVGVHVKLPMVLHMDNQAEMVNMARPDVASPNIADEATSGRAKHIDMRLNFTRSLVQGVLQLQHVESQDMLADILTKTFASGRFNWLPEKMNLRD